MSGMTEKRMAAALRAAKEVFGFDGLRPFQQAVIPALMAKRDVFAVTATGGGKSLCFQLPALILPGPAVIVSPLISLMKDQVDKLRALGVNAVRLSSDVPLGEQCVALADQDLIYVSPERLATARFQQALNGVRLSMVALDEAHCHVEGTLITMADGTQCPVEQVRPGDAVLSVDTQSREPVVQFVDGVHESWVPADCIVDVGTRLTLDHPVYTARGYVAAGLLTASDALLVCDAVRRRMDQAHLFGGAPGAVPPGEGAGLRAPMRPTWRGLLSEKPLTEVLRERGRRPPGCRSAHGQAFAPLGRPVRRWGSRWERSRGDTPPGGDAPASVGRAPGRDRDLLVSGLPLPGGQGCCGGGWSTASSEGATSGGFVEGSGAPCAWLNRDPAVRRAGARPCAVPPGHVRVLSLSVPGTRNYFADGILVHNCAVEWKDFRSSYAHLGGFLDRHPEAVRMACTATADDEVEVGVRSLMRLRDPARVITSPWRPNIEYVVRREASLYDLIDLLGKAQEQAGSQIVYVASRRAAEAVAAELRATGLQAEHYHAGMHPGVRATTQDRFMRGACRCVVATNAFGMGVDKPDVRVIAHWQMPKSLFAYLQETGRASRDGQPAVAWLNITRDAERTHNFLMEVSNPGFHVYERMWAFLTAQQTQPVRVPMFVLACAAGVTKAAFKGQADAALSYLEYTGHLYAASVGTCYEMPVLNMAVAKSLVRTLPGARLDEVRRVVRYEVEDGQADQHMRLVAAGACRSAEASEVVRVELRRRDLALTAGQVADKKQSARTKLLMLHRFADAPDRRAFVESLFVQAGSGSVE